MYAGYKKKACIIGKKIKMIDGVFGPTYQKDVKTQLFFFPLSVLGKWRNVRMGVSSFEMPITVFFFPSCDTLRVSNGYPLSIMENINK